MEEDHLKMISFLVKISLLLQLVLSIHNHKFEAEAVQSELYNRMSNIEARNQRHEKEMSLLKKEKVEDRKEINQLRERVALLESSTFSNLSSGEKFRRRSKRPVRLIPPYINNLINERNNDNEEGTSARRFYGPPSSCGDLKKLGYTLNGYYLIKGVGKWNASKIQVIYCKFHQPTGVKLAAQELVGNVDVKTKTVHFYVQKESSFHSVGVIPFELAKINEGDALNLTSGIFTVPVPGIYHFDFSAVKNYASKYLDIYLQVNGANVGFANSDQPKNTESLDVVSLSASLQLAAGDKVRLFNSGGTLYDSRKHYTHFSGWLVEEDLM